MILFVIDHLIMPDLLIIDDMHAMVYVTMVLDRNL